MNQVTTSRLGDTLRVTLPHGPNAADLSDAKGWAASVPSHDDCMDVDVDIGDAELNTHGVVVLDAFCRELEARGLEVKVITHDPYQDRALRAFIPFTEEAKAPTGARNLTGLDVIHRTTYAVLQWSHVANRSIAGMRSVFGGSARRRTTAFLMAVTDVGLFAIPLVALISLLIGAVLAWQSAPMFEEYGQGVLVAQLVAMSMLREIGPLLTAILVAGRSGSALAAELGTMKVAEELDAMEVMGSDPIKVIVAPRLAAFMVALPILVTVADVVGVIGGGLAAVTTLDLRWADYWEETQKAIEVRHVCVGLIKSMLFGFFITTVSAREGLLTTGGPTGVGRSTTRSVVFSIIWIIIVDAVFTRIILRAGW